MASPTPTPAPPIDGCGNLIASLLAQGGGADPTNPLYPIFFEDVNCSGARFPDSYAEVENQGFDDGKKIRSLIKPSNWTVVADGTNLGDALYGITYTDCSYDIVTSSKPVTGTSADTTAVSLCMGQPPYEYGERFRTSYYPTSDACDLFMRDTYCTKGDNLDTDYCSCFREQKQLQEQYPDLILPVACFGNACPRVGYQTFSMAANNCTIPVCANMVAEASGGLHVTGNTKIECGSREFTIPNLATVTPTATTPDLAPIVETEKTPNYVIVAAVMGIISGFALVLILLMFA